MKLSSAIAIAFVASSVEAANLYIIGDSTTSHYDYSKFWNNAAAATQAGFSSITDFHHYLLQNQLHAWGTFVDQYKSSSIEKVYNLGKGGISSRSWWWQYGTSTCAWPTVRNNVADSNTGSGGAIPHAHFFVDGQPDVDLACPPKPGTDDIVILNLGINDKGSTTLDALTSWTQSVTDTIAGDTNFRLAPNANGLPMGSPIRIQNPALWKTKAFNYTESVWDFSTYYRKMISSLACQQTNTMFSTIGNNAISSAYNPQQLFDSVIYYGSADCVHTGVKFIIMTDQMKFGELFAAATPWLDELKAVVTHYNSVARVPSAAHKIPNVVNSFVVQQKIFSGLNSGGSLGVRQKFGAMTKAAYFGGKDTTHPNYYGARIQAIANICALVNAGNASLVTIPSSFCRTVVPSTVTNVKALAAVEGFLGFSGTKNIEVPQTETVKVNNVPKTYTFNLNSSSYAFLPSSLPAYLS